MGCHSEGRGLRAGGQQYLLRWEGYQEAEALSEKKGSPGDAAAGVLGGSGAASEDAPEEKGDLFSGVAWPLQTGGDSGCFQMFCVV